MSLSPSNGDILKVSIENLCVMDLKLQGTVGESDLTNAVIHCDFLIDFFPKITVMLLVEGGRWCRVLHGGVVWCGQEYLWCLHFPAAVSNTNSYLNLCLYQNYELSQKIHGISSNLSSTRNEVRMKGKRNKAKCRES